MPQLDDDRPDLLLLRESAGLFGHSHLPALTQRVGYSLRDWRAFVILKASFTVAEVNKVSSMQ